MNLGTMLGAGALVLVAAVGVPQYQKYQHRKEGEALYSTAVTTFRQAVNAAESEHDIAEAQIAAKFQTEVAQARTAENAVIDRVKKEYPEVVLK